MICSTYNGDHIFYDDMNKVVQTDDLDFYNKFLSKNMRALEVACGTGRLSQIISKHVEQFIGIDISNDMLNIAKSKNKDINYMLGDMINLDSKQIGKFDIIICAFNSLQHLKSDEDVEKFLKSCSNILNDEGTVIIDIFNPNMKFLNVEGKEEFMYSFYSEYYKDTIQLHEKRKYDEKSRINYITNIYINEKLNLRIESNTFMRQYFPGQLEELISKNHFEIKEKFGDYNYSKFNMNSQKQIFILQKSK